MKQVPEMYDHQKRALSFILNKNYFALFMEQGTGKSKVVIEKVAHLYSKKEIDCVVIISPNAVKEQWVDEQFEEHCPYHINGHIWQGANTQKSRKEFHKFLEDKNNLFIFSINVEAFQSDSLNLYIKAVLDERKPMVIVDESTKIKSGRRKPKRGKRAGAKRTNKILDFFENIKHKGILTGTPTPNSPFDLWSQFEFLKKDFFGMDYFYFQHRYGVLIQKKTEQGKRYTVTLDEKTYSIVKNDLKKLTKLDHRSVENIAFNRGLKAKDIVLIHKSQTFFSFKNLKELRDKISEITFFIKKKDCLDLPNKVYEKLYCDMSKDQKKIYKELKESMYSEYAGEELNITNKVVMYLRLQMITGGLFPYAQSDIKLSKEGEEFFESSFKHKRIKSNGKIKVLLADLEEVSRDTSIIIWARFRGEIEMIVEELIQAEYSCGKYYGGSGTEVIEKFKSKQIQILVANPLKGGEGLNLQVATLHYYYSNSYKADSRLQSEDRSHRIGQINKVTYKDLICRNTVDLHIYKVLKRKENLIEYFRGQDLEGLLS